MADDAGKSSGENVAVAVQSPPGTPRRPKRRCMSKQQKWLCIGLTATVILIAGAALAAVYGAGLWLTSLTYFVRTVNPLMSATSAGPTMTSPSHTISTVVSTGSATQSCDAAAADCKSVSGSPIMRSALSSEATTSTHAAPTTHTVQGGHASASAAASSAPAGGQAKGSASPTAATTTGSKV